MQLAVGRSGRAFGRRCRHAEEPFARRRREAPPLARHGRPGHAVPLLRDVLGPDGGRRAFRARLGGEADDVLDAFLSQALAYESDRAALAAGLRSLHPRQRRRHQARGGRGERRRAGHDRARRQGARGGRRLPGRYRRPDRRAGPARHARQGRQRIADDPAFLWRRIGEEAPELQQARRRDRRRRDASANICASSTSP